MRAKPVIPRAVANRDVEAAVDHYLDEAPVAAALGFIDALERAYQQIGRHPASGSPRYAEDLRVPGLRCIQVPRHPFLIFYVERTDHVDVWRVLHAHRDIPARFREADQE